jgi:hypothetical protein
MKVKISTGSSGLFTICFDPIDNNLFTEIISKYNWATMSYAIGSQCIEEVVLREHDDVVMFMIETSEYSPYLKD